MNILPPGEGLNTQLLKDANSAERAVKQADPVTAIDKTAPSKKESSDDAHAEKREQQSATDTPVNPERRKDDRRKKNIPVILDTRDSHERRSLHNQQNSDTTTQGGIDLKA
ncbi:MAG: hypothetical protein GXP10_04555 [Gammaproteobacteria bacterium]|nr:hypothetical protein [Gammaproteobacteria bacterium]